MNERIKELFRQAQVEVRISIDPHTFNNYLDPNGPHTRIDFSAKKFAELIVRMCADAADMAQEAGCEYAGDYVAEYMGYGEEHGVTEWRAK